MEFKSSRSKNSNTWILAIYETIDGKNSSLQMRHGFTTQIQGAKQRYSILVLALQYLSQGQLQQDFAVSTYQSQIKGVMVWVGISAQAITKPQFAEPGAEINPKYYIEITL